MPVRTVAAQSKIKCFRGIMFCMRRMVLFTAFYALLSLDCLFWVGLFEIQTDQTTQVTRHTLHDKILDKVIETGK